MERRPDAVGDEAGAAMRTRKDPFKEVWASKIVPMLELDEDVVLQPVSQPKPQPFSGETGPL